ncbi:MAG: hypothetical protein OSB42_01745 [Planctomycetota bacterium]|jgi:hypothetical protein|nr:hypothetical protein [Planctomycetota bacterium]
MKDIWLHLFLFLLASTAIVGVTTMLAEPNDAIARLVFPRRWLKFVLTSGAVALMMILLGYTLASI